MHHARFLILPVNPDHDQTEEHMTSSILPLTIAVVLVVLNGFFVAAELALVKVRKFVIE